MRTLNAMVCCLAVGSTCLTAAAQGQPEKRERPPARQPRAEEPGERGPGGPREQLSPEKAKAAWAAEATGVAKRVGASDDQAKAVVKVYTEARENMAKARQELMEKARAAREEGGGGGGGGAGGGGRGREGMQAMEELNTKEREALRKNLAATLSPDQTSKAIASLGSFNPQWDVMVDAVTGFGLEPAKQQQALDTVEDYIVAQGKARASAGEDREAMRTAIMESRQKLMDSMKKLLSAEQFEKFEGAARPGRGGGGGGGGRGGPGGGGGGGG